MTFKNFLKRVNAPLHDNRTVLREGEDIEDWEEVQRKQREKEAIRKEIARCLLPDIVAYFESEQGQRDFAEWKAGQEAAKKEKSEVA
ncbi:MAG: hypothetical protein E7612_06110 [Ruminococcaceae bacterium]|nr:hypothetical protein [Oscillospiraceae bacterium]